MRKLLFLIVAMLLGVTSLPITYAEESIEDTSGDGATVSDEVSPDTSSKEGKKPTWNVKHNEPAKMAMPELTEDQKAALKEIKDAFYIAMKANMEEMKAATTEDEKAEIRAKMKALHEQLLLDIAEISPEMAEHMEANKPAEPKSPKDGGMKPEGKGEKGGMMGGDMQMPELTDEQKEQIKEIMDEFKEKFDALREGVSEATTEEEKKEIHEQVKTLKEEQIEKISEISPEMAEHIKKMEEMWKNKAQGEKGHDGAMKGEGKEGGNSDATGGKSGGQKGKYKEMFAKKLESKLEGLSTERLEKILTKIDAAIEKIETNESMEAAKKERLLAQLEALKELIQEQLDMETDSEELDLDELFAE